ncbi:tyrosine-type recombinase/integrase [Salipiger marinus]|uniref:tyrosine-type recombinase/integrase n=1 Tax=Salipiger marinus TaxID=555512 RepID=UPI00405A03D5
MGQGNRGGVVRLVGIMTVRKGDRVFTYFRKRGRSLVPLPDLPHDDPAFLAAYAEARKGAEKPQAAKGSIAALILACCRSERFLAASEGYRSILRRHFDAIRESYGALSASGLRDRHIAKDVKTSTAPDHRMKAWRFLCDFAVWADLLTVDPSIGVKAPRRAKTEGHPPWSAEEVAAYRARWPIDSAPRRAMELLYWTGARISDAVMIGPGMVDAHGVLTYRQKKTGDVAHAPWTCALPPYAAQWSADRDTMHAAVAHGAGHMTFLATAQGRTRSEKALGTLIRESAQEAGFAKSAHGLRKSRAVMLAEAGATPHQIGAWTGHHTLQEVEHYTRKADRRRAVMGTEQGENDANRHGQMCKP